MNSSTSVLLSAGTGCTQVTVGSRRGSQEQLYGLPKASLCSHLSHGSAVMHRHCGELVGVSLLLRVSLLSLLSQPAAATTFLNEGFHFCGLMRTVWP